MSPAGRSFLLGAVLEPVEVGGVAAGLARGGGVQADVRAGEQGARSLVAKRARVRAGGQLLPAVLREPVEKTASAFFTLTPLFS